MLFLGAGASATSQNRSGESPPSGSRLAELLADRIELDFDSDRDDLKSVTNLAQDRLGQEQFSEILREFYAYCDPSSEYKSLSRYYWPRIYTTNIDDCVERAYSSGTMQNLSVQNHNFPVRDRTRDQSILELIKLNGNVHSLHDGVIFSVDEYARGHARNYSWYEQLAIDFLNNTFVFIGTELDEPIFNHHIEKLIGHYGISDRSHLGDSFVFCPSFSKIKKAYLSSKNFCPIDGTFSDFCDLVQSCLGDTLTVENVLEQNSPGIHALARDIAGGVTPEILKTAHDVTVVNEESFEHLKGAKTGIKDYYYGAPPTWEDIVNNVHAQTELVRSVQSKLDSTKALIVLHGPAGCGKSTAVRAAAYRYSLSKRDAPVLFVDKKYDFPRHLIKLLCGNTDYSPLFIVDDFEWCHGEIVELFESGNINNARFLVSERSTAWNRVKAKFSEIDLKVERAFHFSEEDVPKLLAKLEEHGPWARLAKMSPDERTTEFLDRSDKQLLVAMREATDGRDFDTILIDEYEKIVGEYEEVAFIISGLATLHRLRVPTDTFDITLRRRFGKVAIPRDLGLEGVLVERDGGVQLRHAVIADFLIRNVVEKDKLFVAIRALVGSYTRFKSPVRLNATNLDYQVFSSLLNSKFLKDVFRSRPHLGLELYKDFEKDFEEDGLYWLHYSLFEDTLGKNFRESAVNHIRQALNAFPSSFQIIHAYATLHFKMASESNNLVVVRDLLEEATRILEEQVSERPNDTYPIVALSEGRARVYRTQFPDEYEKEVEFLVGRIREMQKGGSEDARLQQTIRNLTLDLHKWRTNRKAGRRGNRGRRR